MADNFLKKIELKLKKVMENFINGNIPPDLFTIDKQINPKKIKKILLLRQDRIGDLLISSSFVRNLKLLIPEAQVGMSIKCLDGEDKGMEARYTTTSVGGKKAVQALAVAIATQVEKDQAKPVPVVELGKEHYTHKSYGRIFTPIFKVLEWASMDGSVEASEAGAELDALEPPPVEGAAAAPARRRRSGA